MKYTKIIVLALLPLFSFGSLAAQTVASVKADFVAFVLKTNADDYDHAAVSLSHFKSGIKSLLVEDNEKALELITAMDDEYGGVQYQQSDDGNLIVLSWDDGRGGTMRYFDGVYAYKVGNTWKTEDRYTQEEGEDIGGNTVYGVHQVVSEKKLPVYLVFELFIGGNALSGHTVRSVTIEDGKLQANAQYLKTGSGMHNTISYEMDWSTLSNDSNPIDRAEERLVFDAATSSFFIPVILKDGKLTDRKIQYQFNGAYFQKVQ